ncbi:MAG: IS200/IS605 family transposase [Gemmatimonadales bacterium]
MPVTLYAHLTWTTLRREPLIDKAIEEFLRRFLPHAARRHGADVLAAGIVNDHLHLLIMLPPVIDIPRLVQGLKGASARVANRDGIARAEKLRWASGYDLRSVSPRAVPAARRYIESQPHRHPLSRTGPARATE